MNWKQFIKAAYGQRYLHQNLLIIILPDTIMSNTAIPESVNSVDRVASITGQS